MRTNGRDEIPKASHPASSSTMSINSLKPAEFPFKRLSSLPQLSYALENLAMSIATIITACADCILTLYLWIPLGLTRSVIQNVLTPLLRFLTSQPHSSASNNTETQTQIILPRVIVISGASSGIGASLVKTYAGPNNILVLLARNPARLNQVAKLARTAGCKAVETHSIDYAQDGAENSITIAIQTAHQKYGSIDLAISNAGTATFTDDDPNGPEPWGKNVCLRMIFSFSGLGSHPCDFFFLLLFSDCTKTHQNQRDLELCLHNDGVGTHEKATLGKREWQKKNTHTHEIQVYKGD
jgi:hypothetical protein